MPPEKVQAALAATKRALIFYRDSTAKPIEFKGLAAYLFYLCVLRFRDFEIISPQYV